MEFNYKIEPLPELQVNRTSEDSQVPDGSIKGRSAGVNGVKATLSQGKPLEIGECVELGAKVEYGHILKK